MTSAATEMRPASVLSRALRGVLWIGAGYVASQALRLGANLLLTRILFPEAFGLMAMVTVFMVGLRMFSDIGIGPAISQSARGDDEDFLNTAWTIQVFRGFALWLVTCGLAWPISAFYGEPALLYLLPIAGLTLLISGFDPTRVETAHRHLSVALVTRLDLLSQVIGVVSMVALAFAMQSVMALVLGNIIGITAYLVLMHVYLPGPVNRFRWEPSAGRELTHFGKWIFASTIAGFFTSQGDRAILGKALTMGLLGIYNIGYFLASFPILLGQAVTGRVLIPIYREMPADGGKANQRKLRKMRFAITAAIMAIMLSMAFVGVPLVNLLYDARYAMAGAIVVAVCCAQIPMVIGMTYEQAALAAGNSRGFFMLSLVRASLQIGCLLTGTIMAGLSGALIGIAVAGVLTHPAIVLLARRHRVWDPVHDLTYAAIGAGFGGLALWLNWAAVVAL